MEKGIQQFREFLTRQGGKNFLWTPRIVDVVQKPGGVHHDAAVGWKCRNWGMEGSIRKVQRGWLRNPLEVYCTC